MNLLHDFFNRFSNTVLLCALGFATLGILLVLFIEAVPSLAFTSTVIFFLAGISLLAKNGHFTRSKFIRFINLSIAAYLIGILFKVLHWPGADIILFVASFSVVVVYSLGFISKPIKNTLDIAKLVWVLIFITSRLLLVFHWPYGDETSILSMVMLLLLVGMLFFENPGLLKEENKIE